MADKKISDFTAMTSIGASDLVELETSGGNSRKATYSLFRGLLATYSPSAAASVDIEDFSGLGVAAVLIRLDLITSVDGAGITALYKLNGGYKSGAGTYRWISRQISSGNSTSSDASNAAALIQIVRTDATWGSGNNTLEGISGTLQIENPSTATPKRMTHNLCHVAPSGSIIHQSGSAHYEGTDYASALQGIRLATSSGTMTGTIRVYALA